MIKGEHINSITDIQKTTNPQIRAIITNIAAINSPKNSLLLFIS